MGNIGGDTYQGTIPIGTVALPAVQYYIEATDLASPANTASSLNPPAPSATSSPSPDTPPWQISGPSSTVS